MKKLLYLILLMPQLLFAQTYRQLADSALKVMHSAKDDDVAVVYPRAYALYQQAFSRYPAEADGLGYYKAGSIAMDLGKKDEAFMYLHKAIEAGDWDIVLWKYARSEFANLVTDPRWDGLVKVAKAKQLAFNNALINQQRELESKGILQRLDVSKDDAPTAYRKIKAYNNYPALKERTISMQVPLADTLHTAFLIVLPHHYDAKKAYPLLFFLHGAVSSNVGYLDKAEGRDTSDWNRYYTKYADSHQVVMVYAHANRDYNWMYPDKGFFMIPAILKQVRQVVHIDDDKVFISGHSNGATGSFSYMMKQPSPFAGFYGFNTRPKVATGGTYLRNALNRSFFNVSVDEDYYYPPSAHDSLSAVMKRLGADYQDHRYNGFPHWFPQFNESEPAYNLLFNDLDKRKRNPFHPTIYWQCDDVKYGRCDWLNITALDTLQNPANWQQNITYPIKKWIVLDKKNNANERDTLINAFPNIKKSGAVTASYKDNVFDIKTSDVKAFSIYLSPDMVDISKPVTIMLNGKLYINKKMGYDKDFMLKEFNATADRSALWVNHIDVVL